MKKNTTLILTVTTLTVFGATVLYLGAGEKTKEKFEPTKTETPIVQTVSATETPKTIQQPDTTVTKRETVKPSTDHYHTAVDEIAEMLNGQRPLSFKRAVFLTENAYYEGTLNWEQFCNDIDQIKAIVNKMIAAKGLQKVKTAGNWAIFSYMTEKISENNFAPFRYDFENFMGDKDYESFMVSALLRTKKGNCHSLPYLYKILANEVNVEAFVATAPMHCFIKHKDEKGQWWNLELTSGTFSRTSFIMESFNVSDAGMESGLYMKPLSDNESIALCLGDLVDYYEKKTSEFHGEMVRKAYTEGLKVYPNSLLQLVKRDEVKYRLDKEMEKKGLNDYHKIKPYPELVKLFDEFKNIDKYIQQIGYSKLTAEQYREKVQQIEQGKTTQTKK